MTEMARLADSLAPFGPTMSLAVGTVAAPIGSSMELVRVILGETERTVTVPYEHRGVAARAREGYQDSVQVLLYGNQAWIHSALSPQWQQNGDTITFNDPYSDMGSAWKIAGGIVYMSLVMQRSSNISAGSDGNVTGDPIVANISAALQTAETMWVTAVGTNGSSAAIFRLDTFTGEIKLVAGTASQVLVGTAGDTVLGFSYPL